ncbi:hypothetical protein [Polycladidibacter stylochi]|uniref:hypothetical protein n=1 Tax=Polycladidibacter stylochi TaxID=1807766 RepID=UPI00082F704C|nr:hypothetical protein [Pseudovibrio stylochi]
MALKKITCLFFIYATLTTSALAHGLSCDEIDDTIELMEDIGDEVFLTGNQVSPKFSRVLDLSSEIAEDISEEYGSERMIDIADDMRIAFEIKDADDYLEAADDMADELRLARKRHCH